MHRKLYFEEEEYESAKDAFEEATKLGYKGEVELWIRKCKAELGTPEGRITPWLRLWGTADCQLNLFFHVCSSTDKPSKRVKFEWLFAETEA